MRARVLATAALLSLAVAGCGRPVEVPDVDTTGMEPQVAARIRATREVVLSNPASSRAWGELGMNFQAHTLYLEAERCYARAAELEPGEYRWPYLGAVCRAKLDPVAALEGFERAVALGPDDAALRVRYGQALAAAGRGAAAAEQFRAALAGDPGLDAALQGLARLALQEGDVGKARELLEQAAGIAPHHGEIHRLLAQVYGRLGLEERARLAALSGRAYPEDSSLPDPVLAQVEAHAVSSRAFGRRGVELARAGRYAQAEAAFREVLKRRTPSARDLANLGAALAGQKRYDEAVARFEDALRLDPRETYALSNLAMTRLQQGRLPEAEARLREALAIDPDYADALHNLGLVLEHQGRSGEAVETLRRALEADPAHGGALNDLARMLAVRGEETEAARLWRRAVSIDPLNLEALYNLAQALSRQGAHAESVASLERALERAPNSSILSQALAWELATAPEASLRDGRRAVQIAARVESQYPDRPAAGDVLAAALAESGDYHGAAERAAKALEDATAAGQVELARQIRHRLALYRKGEPFRQGRTAHPRPTSTDEESP